MRGQAQFQENLYVIDENAEDEENNTFKLKPGQIAENKQKQVHSSFIFDEEDEE